MRLVPTVLVAGLLGLVAGLATPAYAATDRLALSWDGQVWRPMLSGTLFGGEGSTETWVPGDADTRTAYVRNRSSDDAMLTVQYLLAPSVLTAPGNLRLSVRVGTGGWRDLPPGTTWTTVETSALAAGRRTTVSVRGALAWSSGNSSQSQTSSVAFRVQLAGIPAETAAGGGGGSGPDASGSTADDQQSGGLAATGAGEVDWLVGLGAVCLAGGILIVARARRREDGDAEAS